MTVISVTTGQTNTQTDRRQTNKMYHHFVQGQEIHLRVKDLQSMTKVAEWWTLQIFDSRVDFPVFVESGG